MGNYSGYYQDAINHSIPDILKELEELVEGFDEEDEKLDAMKKIRVRLQKIFAGYMKLDRKKCSK